MAATDPEWGRKAPVSCRIHNNASLPGKYTHLLNSDVQSNTDFLQAKAVGIYFSRPDWRRYTTVSTSWVNWPLCVKLVAFPFNVSHDVVLMFESLFSLLAETEEQSDLVLMLLYHVTLANYNRSSNLWKILVINTKYWSSCRNCLHVRHSLCRLLKSCFCLQIKKIFMERNDHPKTLLTTASHCHCVLKEQFTQEWN